ncbi:hypothetical protein FWH13_00335 [Candidatus Saccharibacteria bacterium]|nr:hypothetical protein [Candidatus Saccharibacteria bacterium]
MAKRLLTYIYDVSSDGRVVISGGELESETGRCRMCASCDSESVAQECRMYCGREVYVDISGSTILAIG